MEKEIKIQVPEGYEIDKEKSTFEKIVFKKKETIVNCWEDIKWIDGIYINDFSVYAHCAHVSNVPDNRNVFLNKKYAKSALALAQISQLLSYYDSNVDWGRYNYKYCIRRERNKIVIQTGQYIYSHLAFNTKEEAERFLKYNEQLVKDYYMID